MPSSDTQPVAQPTPVRDLRIGVYICRCGGNISDVVDVEQVAQASRHLPGVAVARIHTFMCSDPGQQAISEDIQKEKLDRVVVASCTPFLHELTFRGAVARGGLNPYLYEHVNIREQCSWAHKHDPAGATAKATRLIAAAVGKLHHVRPLDQVHLPNHRKALVIGGGIAGLKAAADLAARGIPVLLVEASDRLGGRLNDWGRVFPSEQPARDLVARLVDQVRQEARIEILLQSQLTAVTGFIGNFQATITGPLGPAGQAHTTQATVGVIIVATGFAPYVPRDGEFLYRQSPRVVTLPDFIRGLGEADPQAPSLLWQGRAVRSVAFIHCVGSRQLDGVHEPQPDGRINNYCSRVCCTTTLQQALAVKRQFPGVEVFDLHQDIRTYGRGHEDYYIQASQAGVVFFRYHGDEPPVVQVDPADPDAALRLQFKDYLTWGEELILPVDLVVLSVGMTPGNALVGDGDHSLAQMLKIPTGEDRFYQEIHPKLRPVEVSVNGVLLAGAAQGPMNIQEALSAAGAAAAKASAMFVKDDVELHPFIAAVDPELCEGTGQCLTQCEYEGALQLVEQEIAGQTVRRAQVNPGLCVGCGACAAVCPHRAINVNGWTVDQYDAMVDGLVADLAQPAAVA